MGDQSQKPPWEIAKERKESPDDTKVPPWELAAKKEDAPKSEKKSIFGKMADSAYDSLSSANDALYNYAGVKKPPGAGPIPDPGLLLPLLFAPGAAAASNSAIKSAKAFDSLARITKANSNVPILYDSAMTVAPAVEKTAQNPLARRLGKWALGAAGSAGSYLLGRMSGRK